MWSSRKVLLVTWPGTLMQAILISTVSSGQLLQHTVFFASLLTPSGQGMSSFSCWTMLMATLRSCARLLLVAGGEVLKLQNHMDGWVTNYGWLKVLEIDIFFKVTFTLRIASLSYHIHIKTFGIRFLKALKLNLTPLSLNFDFLGGQT